MKSEYPLRSDTFFSVNLSAFGQPFLLLSQAETRKALNGYFFHRKYCTMCRMIQIPVCQIVRSIEMDSQQASETVETSAPQPSQPPPGQDQKFCMDCGKVILRRAEICPGCGCRQLPTTANTPFNPPIARPPELQSQFVSQMAILLVLNVLWNGLGNLAIGDKRGWQYGFLNLLFFALSFVTVGIPCILFFAYCGYAGYQFLLEQQSK
jgi:hypothetical protein